MVKIHIYTNYPEEFNNQICPYSKSLIFNKKKVKDMLIMCDLMPSLMHRNDNFFCLDDARFTIMGLCKYLLSPSDNTDELYTLPLFLVPSTMQEPIALRFFSDTDASIALNYQHHKERTLPSCTQQHHQIQCR
jgi:hypothetical protein